MVFEQLPLAKELRISFGRTDEGAAKGGAEDGANVPDQRHDTKGTRLKFFLGHELGDSGSNDADITVGKTLQGAEDEGPDKVLGEAKHDAEDHGESESSQNDGLPAIAVRGASPGNTCQTL